MKGNTRRVGSKEQGSYLLCMQPISKSDLKTQEDILVKQTVPVYNESTLLQLSSTQKNGHDWQTDKNT